MTIANLHCKQLPEHLPVHPKHIDESAHRLLNAGTVSREALEQLGGTWLGTDCYSMMSMWMGFSGCGMNCGRGRQQDYRQDDV